MGGGKGEQEQQGTTQGRWLRRSSVEEAEEEGGSEPGYRCPSNGVGGYGWVEQAGLDRKAALGCVRRLPPKANASHSKLVLMGDSFSRQVGGGRMSGGWGVVAV